MGFNNIENTLSRINNTSKVTHKAPAIADEIIETNVSALPILGDTPDTFQDFFLLGEHILGLGTKELSESQKEAYKSLKEHPNKILPLLKSSERNIWMCYWDWDKNTQPDDTFMRPIKESIYEIMSLWKINANPTEVLLTLRELIKNTGDHGTGSSIFIIYQDSTEYIFSYRESGKGILESEYALGLKEQKISGDELIYRIFSSGITSKPHSGVNCGVGSSVIFQSKNMGLTLYDSGKKISTNNSNQNNLLVEETDRKFPGILYIKRKKVEEINS